VRCAFAAAAAFVILSWGCNSSSTTSVVPGPTAPTSAASPRDVSVEGAALVFWNTALTFHARVTLADGRSVVPDKAEWLSSAPTIASVDAHGVVRGLSSGEATISATVGGVTGQQAVRVLPDYNGTWRGTDTLVSCEGYYCPQNPKPDTVELRVSQSGAAITGRIFFNGNFDDRFGYIVGHVETDGALILDRGFLDKSGRPDVPLLEWRTQLSQDGVTITGAYRAGWEDFRTIRSTITVTRVQ
jgi:hypothetical protein